MSQRPYFTKIHSGFLVHNGNRAQVGCIIRHAVDRWQLKIGQYDYEYLRLGDAKHAAEREIRIQDL
jgi:hypothetical protein